MKMTKPLVFFLFIGLFVAGCTTSVQKERNVYTDEAVKVRIQKLETSSGAAGQSYIGTIQESVSVPLSFLIIGTAEKVLVEEGQCVKKGQLLAVLNSESYRNAYQIALSKENQAEDAFKRLDLIYKNGSLPEIKLVEVQTGLEQARSLAAIAKRNLKDCNLYAPTDGVIGKRLIEPGMSIIPGNPVLKLVKIDKVKISIPVPEREISELKKGMKAQVRVSALGTRLFEGNVTEIGVLSNPFSHTYTVKIELDNPELMLKPGMVCEVAIDNPEVLRRIIIPISAIQVEGDNSKFVYVVNSVTGRAEKRAIVTGALAGNGLVVEEGLSEGDLLITEGVQKIRNNSLIQIIR